MKEETETICPRCNGTGKARSFRNMPKFPLSVLKNAEELYQKGLTLRQIGKEIGVKHPQTVKNILIHTGAMSKYNRNLRKWEA